MINKSLFRGGAALSASLLLFSCGQQAVQPAAGQTAGQAYRPAYIMSVPPTVGTLSLGVSSKKRPHGRVISVDKNDGYALMGLTADEMNEMKQYQQNQGGAAPVEGEPAPEPNLNQFAGGALALMNGTRSLWASGEWQAWAVGTRSLWASGEYTPITQNTNSFKQINLEAAQVLAPNLGAGVKVAVIDTGLDLNHPAFNGALAPASEWWDFYGNDPVPQDEGTLGVGGYGHGTAVASIVLQIAPKATILPLRVLGPDGSGDTLMVAQAIKYAVAKGAKIINLSLGSAEKSDTIQREITNATGAGVLVVASAGNDNLKSITFPASLAADKGRVGDGSISVGSVDATDHKSSFSNYSDKLELVAPGENVFTAGPGNLLVAWSGTSMAAPIVAGGLALALGQLPNVASKDLTGYMLGNATNIDALNKGYQGLLGEGRLDLKAFLTLPTQR